MDDVRLAAIKLKLISNQLKVNRLKPCAPNLTKIHRAHSRTVPHSLPRPVTFKLTPGESTVTVDDVILDSRSDNLLFPLEQFESAASNVEVTFNDFRNLSMNHDRSLPSNVNLGGRCAENFVQPRQAPDSEIPAQMLDLTGISRYWNTTREIFKAPAQQIGLPVRHNADLSSGAQDVDDDAQFRSSLQNTSLQARRSTESASPPPERDKFLAKYSKSSGRCSSSHWKSVNSGDASGFTAPALSTSKVELRRFFDSAHLESAKLSLWMNRFYSFRFCSPKLLHEEIIKSSLARKYEFIVIDNAESYLKLACAQRDKRSIVDFYIDALHRFEHYLEAIKHRLNWPFLMICAQTDLLPHENGVKRQQVLPLEFVARLLHHQILQFIHNPDVSSNTHFSYAEFIRECLELPSSPAKIATNEADFVLEKKLEQQYRARTLKPGDQVALYPPESAFELILKPHIYFQNLGGRLGKRSSGSGNAPQLTSQKNPPTGTTSSASTSLPASAVTSCQSSSTTRPSQATSTRRSSSTSLDSPSTTLGPNTAVADSRSKTKIVKVQLDVNLAVFAKRHARFLLVEKRRFSTYLIADWTAAGDNSSFLETVGSKFFATFDLLQLACRALSFRAAMLSLRDSSLRQNTACSRLLYFPPIFSYLHLLPLGNLLRRL
ncbi:unnamed protein product [Oikopleura dioica]|uniref:Uncharacterized protein n=1 Tax=Oikopleura dioica TaxID=34765 RepID=E4XUN0_OIKDI|nr:unnamed protein product [Oikopleura dioica]